MLGGIASGQLNIADAQQSIDLRNVEGLREDVIAALKQHGVDPGSPHAVDASQVSGLQEAIAQAFQTHGVDLAALSGMAAGGMAIGAGATPAAGTPGDSQAVTAQLKQLEDLKAQGILSEDEYQQQRQKVLDQL
jgi:hypothetical protein